MGLASTEFSGSSADSSSGLCDASSSIVLGGLLDLWAFQGSAKMCIKLLEHGKVTVPLEGESLMPSVIQIIQLEEIAFSTNVETSPMSTRIKFQNVQFAYIK